MCFITVEAKYNVHFFATGFSQSLNASVLELPYTAGFSMLVLLPTVDAWRAENVVKRLTHRRLEDIRTRLMPMEMDVTMPKFDITSRLTHQLKQVMNSLI